MSLRDRAAQFAPFAALTGFDEKIDNVSQTVNKTEEKFDIPAKEDF